MKRILRAVLAFFSAFIILTSCDTVRSILGKPTSADLEKLRQEQLAREKAVRDSIAQAREEAARLEAEKAAEVQIKHYYVVVGSFSVPENAERCSEKMEKNGFEVKRFKFRNGLNVVSILGTDNLRQAYADCEKVCDLLDTIEPWVYNTEYKFHE